MPTSPTPPVRENLLLNFGCNLILPVLLLIKGSSFLPLPQQVIVLLALAFPVGYFIYDYRQRGTRNPISILGFCSVLLTGGIGLMKASPLVFAIKETTIPLLMGVFVIASLKLKRPFVSYFLSNPELINVTKLEDALDTPEKRVGLERLQVEASWIMAGSFLVSATLNFILARWLVTTDPRLSDADYEAFTAQIGQMTWVSLLVITCATLPIMVWALIHLFKGIGKLTGLGLNDLMHDPGSEKRS